MEEGEGIKHFPLCLWVLLSSCVHRIDNSVRRHQDAAKRPESGLTCAMFLVTAEYPFQKTLQCCDIVAMSLFSSRFSLSQEPLPLKKFPVPSFSGARQYPATVRSAEAARSIS